MECNRGANPGKYFAPADSPPNAASGQQDSAKPSVLPSRFESKIPI
jgi:hypothetical protein